MELREFIKTSIAEIVAGVADAKEEIREHGATAGAEKLYGYVKENKVLTNAAGNPITFVDFDIALAETNSKDTKGGIGVFLGGVGAGSQGASHGESTSHSRIKFKVPVVLPQST